MKEGTVPTPSRRRVLVALLAVAWLGIAMSKVVSFVRDREIGASMVVAVVELAIGSALYFPGCASVALRVSALLSAVLAIGTLLPTRMLAQLEGACGCLGAFDASVPLRRFIALALLACSSLVLAKGDGESRHKATPPAQ